MIEITWEVEDSTGEQEIGTIEVDHGAIIKASELRGLVEDDFTERSGSFEDYAQDCAVVRVMLDDLWIELDSPQSREQTIAVSSTTEGNS